MSEAPRLINRVVMPKSGDHYAGACPLFGYPYHLIVRKHADGIETEVWDGPPVGVSLLDDAP